MVGILLLAIFNFRKKNFFHAFLENPVNLGIIIFFLIHFISLLYSTDKQSGLEIIQRRLPLFVLPMAFCFVDFEKKTWNKILLFYAFSTTIASVVGFCYGFYLNVKLHDTGYLYNDNISALLMGKQAVYFAFYVNIAVFIFIYHLLQKEEIIRKLHFIIGASVLWLLFISFMLACKTAMVGLLIILLWTVISYLIRKRKFFEIVIISVAIIIGGFLAVKVSPKTLNRFEGITQTDFQFENRNKENHFNAEYDENKWSSTNTRVAIWSCGFEIWKEHFIIGTGIGDRDAALLKKYKEKQFWFAYTTEKHTHNQYLDVALSMGIIGLIIFLTVFLIFPIKIFLKKKQGLAMMIFVCLAICLLTENMLNRYQGLILIALILPLVSKIKDKKEPAITDSPEHTC
jgi:O-antigen ligase